ncbi:MAG: MotA/TolQ/ExbB proton channel family protein [Bacteroides sp.]|nr:MotA/TolQ/ExbB proton channel family protein [Bacteroides sp.]MDE7188993.1 MotA/TolQ/ExbB proton channel family protein [Muribaculaceae bacterium]
MNVISNILYWISTGLLVPVIVLLIYFFVRAIILIGGFYGQYMTQRKTVSLLDNEIKDFNPQETAKLLETLPDKSGVPVIKSLKEILTTKDNEARLDMLVSEYELTADKNVATSKILTKMGPILGLMGTLIPMGPALVGLATGDIASMAYNMQVAFATTVVGLVVSAIGFITQQAKERWASHNLMILDFVVQSLKECKK